MSNHPRPVSDEAQFRRMMANFSDFGDWHFRQAAAYGFVPPQVATLGGKAGRVEVWGGRAHRTEVWVIGRDKSETMVACDCNCVDGSLRQAISEACKLAGVQGRLMLNDA